MSHRDTATYEENRGCFHHIIMVTPRDYIVTATIYSEEEILFCVKLSLIFV